MAKVYRSRVNGIVVTIDEKNPAHNIIGQVGNGTDEADLDDNLFFEQIHEKNDQNRNSKK